VEEEENLKTKNHSADQSGQNCLKATDFRLLLPKKKNPKIRPAHRADLLLLLPKINKFQTPGFVASFKTQQNHKTINFSFSGFHKEE
jgi:hypothetical protein